MQQGLGSIKEIIRFLDNEVPRSLQEGYDNSGLQVESEGDELRGILLAVDITEEVILEAVGTGCNLIVTHHPLLFKGIKKLSRQTYIERCVRLAIKHDIAIYALHTNLDNIKGGVNYKWAEMMGLSQCQTIMPMEQSLYKIVIYTPLSSGDAIRTALRDAGVGVQGDYDGCSFTASGQGRFRPLDGAHPYVGDLGVWHTESEEAISTLCHKHELSKALSTIKAVHPYEEPAIDVIPLLNTDPSYGSGIIGDLSEEVSVEDLLDKMLGIMPITHIAHSRILKPMVRRIAYCGGSGAFLRSHAARMGADIFITGEAKYNDYYDAIDEITLVTIGHYESEELTKSLLCDILCKKIPKFAVRYSVHCANPIQHYFRSKYKDR